jgi:hypothetical protein
MEQERNWHYMDSSELEKVFKIVNGVFQMWKKLSKLLKIWALSRKMLQKAEKLTKCEVVKVCRLLFLRKVPENGAFHREKRLQECSIPYSKVCNTNANWSKNRHFVLLNRR